MPNLSVEKTPRLTIGVPTFNREKLLFDCLTSISEQTYRDFVVLIYDNASVDRTAAIAKEFVSKDARFRYLRHDINIGLFSNFLAVLKAANTPLFLWRADDDRWPQNYLEALVACLNANPWAKLATGKIFVKYKDGANLQVQEIASFDRGTLGRMRMMYRIPASLLYGLFERKTLTEIMDTISDECREMAASDFLILFYYFLEDLVAGTNETYFHTILNKMPRPPGRTLAAIQEIKAFNRSVILHGQVFKIAADRTIEGIRNGFDELKEKTTTKLSKLDVMKKDRSLFLKFAADWIYKHDSNLFQKRIWLIFVWLLVGRRLYSARRVFKYTILRRLLKT